MCMFCAAIPAAAAAGAALNNKQVQARKHQEASSSEKLEMPILKITAGVVALLLAGSITYHTLTFRV